MGVKGGELPGEQKQVHVVAPISRGGQAIGQSGDLEGGVAQAAAGATGVQMVIDKIKK